MSEQNRYPSNADQAEQFLGALRFDDSAPEPDLPGPDTPVTVSKTVRIPFEVNESIEAEAKNRGVPFAVVFREWLTIGMAAATQDQSDDAPVSRAEVRRVLTLALSSLHPVQRSA
ncbi:hypothetical protein [Nocardia noduli]|uniref:hypothetical protein n=1 Tax=Nocardia noduli TaxID=2815722 RepID=UPI001C238CB2|nr:hypothetical protein [Nocardia noduli]